LRKERKKLPKHGLLGRGGGIQVLGKNKKEKNKLKIVVAHVWNFVLG
jgi:hypothetical protein